MNGNAGWLVDRHGVQGSIANARLNGLDNAATGGNGI